MLQSNAFFQFFCKYAKLIMFLNIKTLLERFFYRISFASPTIDYTLARSKYAHKQKAWTNVLDTEYNA